MLDLIKSGKSSRFGNGQQDERYHSLASEDKLHADTNDPLQDAEVYLATRALKRKLLYHRLALAFISIILLSLLSHSAVAHLKSSATRLIPSPVPFCTSPPGRAHFGLAQLTHPSLHDESDLRAFSSLRPTTKPHLRRRMEFPPPTRARLHLRPQRSRKVLTPTRRRNPLRPHLQHNALPPTTLPRPITTVHLPLPRHDPHLQR